eukprot:TRINITY_DN2660_c0_g2_i1.p1 TRINITY_DN2660_c0_g2~~TRINITY_DN2660_c0_g2_i1.p1  ORF type:complete len:114 (-),score=27.31 TRINITY_DN2660_c0_g2_i1:34-375(-)
MAVSRRPILPGLAAMLLGALALACLAPSAPMNSGFLAPGSSRAQATQQLQSKDRSSWDSMALGTAAGLLTAEPAHANIFVDELIPYALATSFAIIWGIILGFVLLRLQEAFPE